MWLEDLVNKRGLCAGSRARHREGLVSQSPPELVPQHFPRLCKGSTLRPFSSWVNVQIGPLFGIMSDHPYTEESRLLPKWEWSGWCMHQHPGPWEPWDPPDGKVPLVLCGCQSVSKGLLFTPTTKVPLHSLLLLGYCPINGLYGPEAIWGGICDHKLLHHGDSINRLCLLPSPNNDTDHMTATDVHFTLRQ